MILERLYRPDLAQASYLIACQRSREAIVIDPNRDIERYLDAARATGASITQVAETHVHADFVSGSRELARRTGARLLLSGEGGDEWQYAFAPEEGARLLRDGDSFMIGDVRFDVVHTPGHTPEHLSFIVTDAAATHVPMGLVSGDFVFVGDVGRPDLLERAANVPGTAEQGARLLHRSLQKIARLPDHVQLWPGHGAGSACGRALGAVPSSTLGYERITNWAFGIADEAAFVNAVLAGQPDPAPYFAEMKRVNLEGPPVVGERASPASLSAAELDGIVDNAGATVIDIRSAQAFAAAHVPGTLNIPLGRSFVEWAGWLVPRGSDISLIADGLAAEHVDEAVLTLSLIGLDRVLGFFGDGVLEERARLGGRVEAMPEMNIVELGDTLGSADGVSVVDVRTPAEWRAGHLPGVANIPLAQLAQRMAGLPRDRPLLIHCQSGGRSSIGTSLLRASGLTNAVNLSGGFAAWQGAGLPVERTQEGAVRA
ncbi:MAG: MBL fold metallo-hydrolase [Gemmatimonadaceae bacterium]